MLARLLFWFAANAEPAANNKLSIITNIRIQMKADMILAFAEVLKVIAYFSCLIIISNHVHWLHNDDIQCMTSTAIEELFAYRCLCTSVWNIIRY